MRAKKQNKITASLTLFSLVLGLFLFCRATFSPLPAFAAVTITEEKTNNTINNTNIAGDNFDNCSATPIHQKTPAPVSPQRSDNNNANSSVPSCCFERNTPNSIALVEQNFSKKSVTKFILEPVIFSFLPPANPSFNISSLDPPPPMATQLKSVIKRE